MGNREMKGSKNESRVLSGFEAQAIPLRGGVANMYL